MINFKKGDKVRFKGDGRIGEIFDIEGYNELIMDIEYWVRFPDGQEGTSPMQDLEFAGPKTAFLTELQSLLRKYDAEIKSGAPGSEDSWINITSGGKGWITFDSNPDTFCATITPDNIFNYDKE